MTEGTHMRYLFTQMVIGSDPDSAIVATTEQARWAAPDDPMLTPDMLGVAAKLEYAIVTRPQRVSAAKLVAWIRQEESAPAGMIDLVEELRRDALDVTSAGLLVPFSYRETTGEMMRRGLRPEHGRRRPFIAYALGAIALPAAKTPHTVATRRGRRAA